VAHGSSGSPSNTPCKQHFLKLPWTMESSPATTVPARRSVMRALLTRTRTLFSFRLIIAAIAGFILRRLLQQRDVSGLGWMLLHRLGLVHSGLTTQATTLKSNNTASFARFLQLLPAEDTDGIEEPSPQKVREISVQSSTCASSKRAEELSLDDSPECFETWSSPTEANVCKEEEQKRAEADAQVMVDLLPSLPAVSTSASALTAPLPAMQSLTIKLLAPASAKENGARCYWGSAQRARAAKMLTLMDLTSAATVAQVKARVAAETGISLTSLRLLLFGCKLQDARTLKSYGIDNVSDPLIHALPLMPAPA